MSNCVTIKKNLTMIEIRCVVYCFIYFGLTYHTVNTEDDISKRTKLDYVELRRNYTPNDLIQQLARLAEEELQPRLRFPTSDFEDDPFYQSNLNSDEVVNNQQNYQQLQQQNYQQIQQPNYQQLQQQYNQDLQQQNYQQQQQNFQNPNINYQNQIHDESFGGNGLPANHLQQNYLQNQQFNRPQKIRRPKKQKQNNRYRPQFSISQDPLDPYYQNYPPLNPNYPTVPNYPQRPGFPPVSGQSQFPQQYPPYYPGQYAQQGFGNQDPGAFGNLMDALDSIAKNDDQQCVPRLLCEVAAGGNPSYRQASFLPSFLNTESLFTLLSALSGSVSPLLVFGRAALLGVTSQGRPTSCRYAYPQCPTEPDRLVEYLNNHNGGFFRFFNGLTNQQHNGVYNQQNGIYNQQNGIYNQQNGINNQQNYPQRPTDQTLLDIFNQLSTNNNRRPINNPGQLGVLNQLFGPQNQRPNNHESLYNRGDLNKYNRYPVRYDYQKRTNENGNESQAEARILNSHLTPIQDHLTFVNYQNYKLPITNDLDVSLSYQDNRFANTPNTEIKFPGNFESNAIPDSNNYYTKSTLKFPGESANEIQNSRYPKAINFPSSQSPEYNNLYFPKPLPFYDHSKMIFPDRTGTGNLKFDSNKLNQNYVRPDISNFYTQNRPYYSGQFSSNQQDFYRQEPSSKKYVYIVRGNGDPNHPEIVEDVRGRRKVEIETEDDKKEIENDRDTINTWSFPSPYQGVIYND